MDFITGHIAVPAARENFSYCCTYLYFGLSHERFHKAGEAAVPPAVPRAGDVGLPEAAVRLLAVDIAELVAQLFERVGHVPVHLVLEFHLFDRVLALRAVNVIRVMSVVLLGALEVRLDVFPAPTGISQVPPLVKIFAVAAEVVEPVQIAALDHPRFDRNNFRRDRNKSSPASSQYLSSGIARSLVFVNSSESLLPDLFVVPVVERAREGRHERGDPLQEVGGATSLDEQDAVPALSQPPGGDRPRRPRTHDYVVENGTVLRR